MHISTDAVFDGQSGNYREEDTPHPLGVYARSKLAGEQAVTQANPQAIIARVNFYGWSLNGARAWLSFSTATCRPAKPVQRLHRHILLPAVGKPPGRLAAQDGRKRPAGYIPRGQREALSKYEFGCRIARLFDLDEQLITPVSWKAGGLQAQRSPDLSMHTGKLARDLGISLADQAVGLQRFRALFDSGYAQQISLFRRLLV